MVSLISSSRDMALKFIDLMYRRAQTLLITEGANFSHEIVSGILLDNQTENRDVFYNEYQMMKNG